MIKTIDFTQSYFRGGQLKLDNAFFYGRNDSLYDKYSFGYFNETANLPILPSTPDWPEKEIGTNDPYYSQDTLGYYNGKSNICLIPSLPNNLPLNPELNKYRADRSTSKEYAPTYTLNSIKYITGGETDFVYGCNLQRTPVLHIEKIITKKTTDSSVKLFSYIYDASKGPEDPFGMYSDKSYAEEYSDYPPIDLANRVTWNYSSESMMPGYALSMRTRFKKVNVLTTNSITGDTIKDVYEYDYAPIIMENGRQYFKLPFSDHIGDIKSCMSSVLRGSYESSTSFWLQDWNSNNIGGYVMDKSWIDPLSECHSIYKHNNNTYQLIERTTKQYQYFNRNDKIRMGMYLKGLQFTVSGRPSCQITKVYDSCPDVDNFYFFDIYASTGWKELVSSTTEKMDGDSISKTTGIYQYGYINNNIPFVTSYSEKFGNFDKAQHTCKYVYDINSSDSIVKNKMIACNFISPVIQETVMHSNAAKYPMITDEKNHFDIIKSSGNQMILLNEKSKSITKLDSSIHTKKSEHNWRVVEFDKKGNPLQLIDDIGHSTVYLWSYNYTYLVGKIVNATLGEVRSTIGINIDDLGLSPTYIAKIDSLRGKLPNSQVWTYYYQPLIGIIKETAPNGMTTYYKYDDCNRLKETYYIINGEEKPLHSYDYHYRNY